MERRASIPPELPSRNPTTSYWQDPPSRLASHNAKCKLPQRASTVIIGSGVTGATLAYNILTHHPNPGKVIMLEARTACSGATGRNGGHTKPHSYREFSHNVETLGEAEAAKIVRYKHTCVKQLHAFAREQGIECDSWEGDTVDVFYHEGNWEQAKRGIEQVQTVLGEEDEAAQFRVFGAEETREKFLVEGALGAVSYHAGSLSAYKFGIGVLELAVAKGLGLYTETPVLSLEPVDSPQGVWRVKTSKGDILAERVVMATNGYTARLYPALQGTIVPTRGHMTVQRPPSGLQSGTLKETYSFIYDDGYEYMIPRPQGTKNAGDICIGGGNTKSPNAGLGEYGTTDDTVTDPTVLAYLKDSAMSYFGSNWGEDDPDCRIRQAWTGIMGYSADGFPLIGRMPEQINLWIGASFQGSGMVMCFLAAKALSLMMSEKDDDDLKTWFPEAYRMGKIRLGHKFKGRLHTTAPKDLENTGQT